LILGVLNEFGIARCCENGMLHRENESTSRFEGSNNLCNQSREILQVVQCRRAEDDVVCGRRQFKSFQVGLKVHDRRIWGNPCALASIFWDTSTPRTASAPISRAHRHVHPKPHPRSRNFSPQRSGIKTLNDSHSGAPSRPLICRGSWM